MTDAVVNNFSHLIADDLGKGYLDDDQHMDQLFEES